MRVRGFGVEGGIGFWEKKIDFIDFVFYWVFKGNFIEIFRLK